MSTWLASDKAHCWHPFTQQLEWCAPDHRPLLLVRGNGVWLEDGDGKRYIDGNSSIWTNIHGHNHPHINAAIRAQLDDVAHTSFLGFANPRASELAARLCALFPDGTLERVFFSDDGSTAIETALKMAIQYRLQSGEPERTGFIAFDNAYHGDTMGAASLGGVSGFFSRFRKFGLPARFVPDLTALRALPDEIIRQTAAVVIEPLIQGVNEMRPWPSGLLRDLRAWCDETGVHLILDEVMTGFGRTGTMFACQREGVIPDFLCVAKGITGGYLPLAATFTTAQVYNAFLGGPERAFYYGHSYTASQLGCAAALASLDVFEQEQTLANLPAKISRLTTLLDSLRSSHPAIHETRQCGMVAGIELRQTDGSRFAAAEQIGTRVCIAARNHSLLTRPIRDTIVLMPPLCISDGELAQAVDAIRLAVREVCGG
jgi:adenosylmethionine-8-amino-7-oxononanoate aminotransferase